MKIWRIREYSLLTGSLFKQEPSDPSKNALNRSTTGTYPMHEPIQNSGYASLSGRLFWNFGVDQC
jgi:hypothetical protein